MLAKSKAAIALSTIIGAAACSMTPASAITAEVAKKCDALVTKAFPPRLVGNPAAGSTRGTAQDQRNYFQKCLENGGKMDDELPPSK